MYVAASWNQQANHGLSCRRSGGRISIHQSANETIRRALVSGGIPAVLEPVGVAREDGKRPDGMSLIPWEEGLLWDFTYSDTMALSHRNQVLLAPVRLRAQPSHSKCTNILH